MVAVDYKKLFTRLVRVLFEQKVLQLTEIFRVLEAQFQDGEYYVPGRKLHMGRGYRRVMEIFRCTRLLGVTDQEGKQGEHQLQVLNEEQGQLTERHLRLALQLNKQDRLHVKIFHVYKIYQAEYKRFYGI